MKVFWTGLIASCLLTLTTTCMADTSQQTRLIPSFQSVQIDGPFDVTISPGKKPNLSLTADNAILPWVQTSVSRGRLTISMKPGIKPHYPKRVVVAIEAPSLHNIMASDHAFIRTKNVTEDKLSVELNNHSKLRAQDTTIKTRLSLTLINHSKIDIDGKANQLLVNSNNHSKSTAEDLETQQATITLVNHSQATINTKTALLNESNHSSLKLSDEIKKITGHLQNHSTLDSPKGNTVQSFINDDSEFDCNKEQNEFENI